MTEPTLFNLTAETPLSSQPPLCHRDDPVTSFLAAEELARSGRRRSIEQCGLAALRAQDGSTSDELGRFLGNDSLYPPAD
ncbi:MAG: hypothetical protein JXB13_01695 [Phycisphaerae bacterium]|nr:hypothetical protein [Phycisphaerae bacterium]